MKKTSVLVNVYLEASLAKRIDQARGIIKRATYVHALITEAEKRGVSVTSTNRQKVTTHSVAK